MYAKQPETFHLNTSGNLVWKSKIAKGRWPREHYGSRRGLRTTTPARIIACMKRLPPSAKEQGTFEMESGMTDVQIQETLRSVEQVLKEVRAAEHWAQAGLENDEDSARNLAWLAAQKAARELEGLAQKLRNYASA